MRKKYTSPTFGSTTCMRLRSVGTSCASISRRNSALSIASFQPIQAFAPGRVPINIHASFLPKGELRCSCAKSGFGCQWIGICAPSPTSKILSSTPNSVPYFATCAPPSVSSGNASNSAFSNTTSPLGSWIRLSPLSGGLSLPGVIARFVENIHSSE